MTVRCVSSVHIGWHKIGIHTFYGNREEILVAMTENETLAIFNQKGVG